MPFLQDLVYITFVPFFQLNSIVLKQKRKKYIDRNIRILNGVQKYMPLQKYVESVHFPIVYSGLLRFFISKFEVHISTFCPPPSKSCRFCLLKWNIGEPEQQRSRQIRSCSTHTKPRFSSQHLTTEPARSYPECIAHSKP